MYLTPEQQATLKTAILADQTLNQIYSDGDLGALATALNADKSPAVVVWRSSVSKDEIMQNGFDWVQVDNLTVGKARIWEWLFDNATTTVNPSKANVRAGIEECWKGTAAKLAVQAAVLAHCKRPATVLEALFTTGTGTTASPALLGVEGDVSWYDLTSL
jgi:hypothetical protein